MKVEVILNGTSKLVLIPENDIERAVLGEIGKAEIDATLIANHTQILDKVIQDGLVIKPKPSKIN
jgi:hypothetical protein